MNSLRKLANALENGSNEVIVDDATIKRARGSIQRLLDFTENNPAKQLANDA